MSCYNPIPAFRTPTGVVFSALGRHDIVGDLQIACGQCLGCRLRRARDWSVRVMHEAQSWDANCFVTLTYATGNLPPERSLLYRDFQLFMMRLRKRFAGRRIRFFMCGEYGPVNLRPHYHACLFNVDFPDGRSAGKSGSGEVFFESPLLNEIWGLGRCSVQPLNVSTAAYCARYIVSKVTGDAADGHYSSIDGDGEVHSRVPEFSRCSLKPGIGAFWYDKFGGTDVFPQDFVVAEGTKYAPPKYYDKLMRRSKSVVMDSIEFEREKRAVLCSPDSTPERLRDRAIVHAARVSNLRRVDL